MKESWRATHCFRLPVAALLLIVLGLLPSAVAQTDLAGLSDVELFLHEDRDAARAVLDRRVEGYTPAEKARFQEELMLEIERRTKNRKPLTADELLDRMRNAPHESRGVQATVALRELLERAGESEKEAIRERFLADWELVTYPSLTDKRADAGKERLLFKMYLSESPRLYDNEADFIAMLERRCLNRGIEGEMALFLEGLQAQGDAAGPLTSARIEQYFNEYRTWGVPEIGYSEQGDMLPYMYTALARCGRDGLDVLVRLGKTTTTRGVSMLGTLDLPETEAMLWTIYNNTEEKFGGYRVDVLYSIQKKQKREPTVERRDRIRQELAQYLSIPEQPFYSSGPSKAAHAAGITGDAWFIPHLDAMESELRNLDLSSSSKYADDPENVMKWIEDVLSKIEEARAALSKENS